MTRRVFWLLILLPGLLLAGDDTTKLNRKLDSQIRSLRKTAFKRIEKTLGLVPEKPKSIRVEFRDLTDKMRKDRRIVPSKLEAHDDGTFTVVLYREFARAEISDLKGETTYQAARAVWRQLYPKRAKVAAWFLHGMALHASGLGDDRILFIIADNERRTTEIVDGWEVERKHNARDHADDILLFRYIEKDGEPGVIKDWLQAVAAGAEPHRVVGDPYPGLFAGLERDYRERGKNEIEAMAHRGRKEFLAVYEAYQEAKKAERAKMTGAFIKVLKKYKGAFWEGKARYYLGRCWMDADREEKALAEFRRVLGPLARRSDPRFLDMAKYRLAQMFRDRRRREMAFRTYHEYLRDFTWGKYQAEARLDLAALHLDKRETKKARPLLEWVLANEPDSAAAKKARKILGALQ